LIDKLKNKTLILKLDGIRLVMRQFKKNVDSEREVNLRIGKLRMKQK